MRQKVDPTTISKKATKSRKKLNSANGLKSI